MGRSIRYGTREGTAQFCLGHIPHPAQPEEVVCHSCGALISGAQLGIYQVQQLLGQGRSGSAYLATHLRSKQQVVIKLLPPDHTNVGLWDMARREIRAVTSLRHPSILPVFSCTTWYAEKPTGAGKPLPELMRSSANRGEYLLTLCQYAPGTLARFIAHYEQSERKSIPGEATTLLSRVIRLIQQIGSALHTAHTHGIVHGALLPGNILLDGHDHLWVADFGLARLRPAMQPYLAPELYSVSSASIQQGSMAMYWEEVNPASDQYMLAILCQQLLTRLLRAADYEPVLPVLQCATSQNPSRRFASVEIFVHELVSQITRRRTSPLSQQSGSWNSPSTDTGMDAQIGMVSSSRYPPVSPRENERYNRMASYQLAISALPPSVEDWEKRGDKLFTMHDYDGAARAYQRALEADGGKASIWLALGDAYLALENYAEALRAYEQAMTIDPNDPLAWSNRGTALDALGRHKEAMNCYERADQLR